MIRSSFALGLSLAAAAAWSQSAPVPSFGPDAPWAQAYARCANDAVERLVSTAREPKPWPEELVTQAQRECAGEVPGTGDSSLGVRATVALVRSDVLHRFGPGRSLTLAARPPLALPTMFPMANGVECPHPDYPPPALRSQTSGVSGVEITVDADGLLVDGRVLSPSGLTREHRMLDRTALEAFALCRFPHADTPGTRAFRMSYNWRIVE